MLGEFAVCDVLSEHQGQQDIGEALALIAATTGQVLREKRSEGSVS